MSIKVLVVDNNPVHLHAVTSFLKNYGCQVQIARDGLEAIEKIQQNKPDILFTDLVMPLIDGEKLCRIVRGVDEYRSIFIVVCSAIEPKDRDGLSSFDNFDVYIVKGPLKEIKAHLGAAITEYQKKGRKKSITFGETDADQFKEKPLTAELMKEKEHLRGVLENLSEGVMELSENGRIVSLNKAVKTIWNCSREQVIGQKVGSLSFGKHLDQIVNWCENELGRIDGSRLEINEGDPLIINDRILTAHFIPVQHLGGFYGICIFRDISKQYFAEQRKEEMDSAIKLGKKMEAMSFMAGGVAHDFNNLLSVICGSLDMVCTKSASENMKETLVQIERARQSAYSAVELIQKISHFSPYGIIRRQDILLDSLVVDVCRDYFERNSGPGYSIELRRQDIYANIDKVQIEQVMKNVLDNCMDSISSDPISIFLDQESVENPTIRKNQYLSPGRYAKILIHDRGCGIAENDLQEIFDPYYTTKEKSTKKGLGLGLTIVYTTMRNHGGHVVIDSVEGEGTQVSLYLPQVGKGKADFWEVLQNARVLVVEEDTELRSISQSMLEFLKINVLTTSNCKKAIDILKETKNSPNGVRVVFIHYTEAGKPVSLEVCREMRNIDPSLKLIVCSSATFDPVMQDYAKYGFSAAMAKPYTIEEFRKILSVL